MSKAANNRFVTSLIFRRRGREEGGFEGRRGGAKGLKKDEWTTNSLRLTVRESGNHDGDDIHPKTTSWASGIRSPQK
jgi:hypothetical protein